MTSRQMNICWMIGQVHDRSSYYCRNLVKIQKMFGFNCSSKNKTKLPTHSPTQMNSSNETKKFHLIPSISQIAPLPANNS